MNDSSQTPITIDAPSRRGPATQALLHGARRPSVRHRRVGAARRADRPRRQGRLRADGRRVPEVVVAERDEHRRPEVLPRPARLAHARALRQADGRPRRRHDRRLGPRARLLRHRRGRRRLRGRADATSCSTRSRRSTRPSGSTSASRSSRSARPASSSRVEDTMESILDWNTKEGMIFRGGSGSGINLSNIRGSMEPLAKGGTASGPVSFMRGADSWAGTIKSGGKTRRAAKMVVLDVDHPDIREFIWCKAKEEDKAARAARRRLRHVDRRRRLQLDPVPERQQLGARHRRVHARRRGRRRVAHDRARRPASRSTTLDARELMREIAEAAWRCADPGVQYDTTINQWHTCPNSGRINASNPCSEYMHVDDSACNLASLNLMKFRRADGTFDVEPLRARGRHRLPRAGDRRRAVELPDRGDRRERARVPPARPRLREPRRVPDVQRHAVRLRRGSRHGGGDHRADDRPRLPPSAEIAAAIGPYERYAENREPHNNVMRMHRDAAYAIPDTTCEDDALLGGRARARGTRRSRSATSTATATRRRRCSRRPGRSPS